MYDLKILFKFGLFHTLKAFNDLPFSFLLCIHIHPKPITFRIIFLTTFKKRLKILVQFFLDL
jgi:hypothetical protein